MVLDFMHGDVGFRFQVEAYLKGRMNLISLPPRTGIRILLKWPIPMIVRIGGLALNRNTLFEPRITVTPGLAFISPRVAATLAGWKRI